MAHRYEPLLESELHLVGECEQTHVVRYRGAFLSHLVGHLLLRQAALVDQALHAERYLYGVEVLPLDVLHEGHGMEVLVVGLAHVCG